MRTVHAFAYTVLLLSATGYTGFAEVAANTAPAAGIGVR